MNKMLPLLFASLLTACGGGGGDESPNNNTGTDTGETSEVVSISAADTLNKINRSADGIADIGVVDISNKVVSSNGSELILRNVEPLNAATTTRCQVTQINKLNFEVMADDIGSCFYTYTVATEDGSAATTATNVINVQDVNGASALTLPTITNSTANLNTPLTIDYVTELGVNYPAGAELDKTSLVVLGNGTVTYNDEDDRLIFTGTSEGRSQIYYTLIDYDSMVSYIGIIEVATSDQNFVTSILEVDDSVWPTEIEQDEKITIDIAEYVSNSSYPSDIQIVDVNSFTADVALLDPEDMTNTKFTFEASAFGAHTVTYTVSDKHGNYSLALIVVNVAKDDSEPGEVVKLDWAAITTHNDAINDDTTFLAPPSESIAEYMTDPYIAVNTEDGSTGPLNAKVVEMTYHQAEAYCKKYGGRLPLIREFTTLYNNTSPDGGVFTEHNWPAGRPYWSAEQTSVAGQTRIYDLTTGTSSTATALSDTDAGTTEDSAYVTCVDLSSESATDYTLTAITQTLAYGTTTEVSLKVLDPYGEVAPYKEMLISTEFNRGGFRLDSTESLQDEMYVYANSTGIVNFDYLDTSLNDEVVLMDVSSSRFKNAYISSVYDNISMNVTDPDKWNRVFRARGGAEDFDPIGPKGIQLFSKGGDTAQNGSSNVLKQGQRGKDWLASYVTYSVNLNVNRGRFALFIQQIGNEPESSWIQNNGNPLPIIDDIFATMVDFYVAETAIKFGSTDVSFVKDTPGVIQTKVYQWFEKRGDTLNYYFSDDNIRPAKPTFTVDYHWPGIDPTQDYWVGFNSSAQASREAYITDASFVAY